MLVLKFLLLFSLGSVVHQDIKQREIYWFWIPIIAVTSGILYYHNTLPELFLVSLVMNLLFVSTLIGIIYIYAKLKLKTSFYKIIGLGDVLIFLTLATTFSTISFITIFISGLIFSLVLHLLIKNYSYSQVRTVPLAGYLSLFFTLTYVLYWLGVINSLYSI